MPILWTDTHTTERRRSLRQRQRPTVTGADWALFTIAALAYVVLLVVLFLLATLQ